jgi:hypothetical protein
MIGEIIYLIISIIAFIAIMTRYGIFSRFMLEFLGQRILNELSSLKTSAPNLTSTFNSNNSTSQ